MTGLTEPKLSTGLYRKTQDVRTAFWLESKATCPYFYKLLSKDPARANRRLSYLPIIHSRLLCHEFIDTESTIAHHVALHTDQFRKLPVGFVNFTSASPKAGGNAHRGKYAIVVEEHALERLLDEDKVLHTDEL